MSDKSVKPKATLGTYTLGFVLSIILTLVAFGIVMYEVLTGAMLITVLVVLAVVQLFVQLQFFLHLGRESKPRWNLSVFLFMLLVVAIVVLGSLWIMNNLNYNMMPAEMDSYMQQQRNRGF